MRNLSGLLLVTLFVVSCKKEPVTPSAGFVFETSGGNCNTTVSGLYTTGIPLDASNTVSVQVNVTSPGTYSIITSTISGIKFSDEGSFTNTGIQTITLKGSGTPSHTGSIIFS